ncbi:MAG: metal ABC transporter ATP-binding protein [Pseudomonadota bacterium]
MQATLLSAARLTLGYRAVPVIENVSFELKRGEVLSVVGHNGSGKSTLIKTLLGILLPLSGQLDWGEGKPETIAYLGQQTDFDNRFPIRVRDLAAMGSWSKLGLIGRIDKDRQDRIDTALERTGTTQIADMPLYKLSAGQLQRALFARTMVQDASLILLDEPFTAVDQTTEAELLKLINEWSAEGRTIILVLHDLSAVLEHCHSSLLLGKGRTLFGSPEAVLTPDNLVNFGYLSSSQADWLEAMHSKKRAHHV